jgi:hypothetical protein
VPQESYFNVQEEDIDIALPNIMIKNQQTAMNKKKANLKDKKKINQTILKTKLPSLPTFSSQSFFIPSKSLSLTKTEKSSENMIGRKPSLYTITTSPSSNSPEPTLT